MHENTDLDTKTTTKGFKGSIWLLPVLLAVFLILLNHFGLLPQRKKQLALSPTAPPLSPQQSPTPSSAEEVKAMLIEQKGVYDFAALSGAKALSASALPTDLRNLLMADAADLKIQSVRYADKNTGYKVEFSLPISLPSAHHDFSERLREAQWVLKDSLRAKAASLIEAENARFKVRISQEEIDNQKTYVVIEAVNK